MKFSIITCVLNSEKYLNDCLLSINKQKFRNFEVIIIDGYSTDNSIKIIKKYSSKLPIKVFQQKPRGISAAMNYGIRKAKGEFLIHLHTDDSFYDEDVLGDVNDFLEKNKTLDWIYGKINSTEVNGQLIGVFPNRKIFQIGWSYLLKYTNYIPHQAVFIKKEVFDKHGYFDETISSAMDADLWLRISNKTKWNFFDRIISNYRIHPFAQSSALRNQLININNYETIQRKYTNNIEFILCKIINRIIWKIYKGRNLR